MSTTRPQIVRKSRVICVDLDGTLVETDLLLELVLSCMRRNALNILLFPFWLMRGRANLKARLAENAGIDPSSLPYNEDLVAFLRKEKQSGASLTLATGAPERIARQVAKHLGLFDQVVASSPAENLRGRTKARVLAELYGDQEFVYAGNDRHDLPVWDRASAAIVVSDSRRLRKKITTPVTHVFSRSRKADLGAVLRAVRPHQWVKNVLVFVPLMTAGRLADLAALLPVLGAFACFSFAASCIYVLNDLLDIYADRNHPTKKMRPFAAGDLGLGWGFVLAPLLFVAALAGAFVIDVLLALVVAGYLVLSFAYSTALKTRPLADVFTLSALYELRILAGGAAVGLLPSIWLLNFSAFLFISLALLKRYAELRQAEGRGQPNIDRRGYMSNEHQFLLTIGVAAAFSAAIVLAIYLDSSAADVVYERPQALWAMVPLMLFWLCRIWLSAVRGYVIDDPIVYSARDWVFWLAGSGIVLAYVVAL